MYMEMVVFRGAKQNPERPITHDNEKRHNDRARRDTVHADNGRCAYSRGKENTVNEIRHRFRERLIGNRARYRL